MKKIRKIAVPIAREVELAVQKVAANHTQAANFPLAADKKSLEQILSSRFKTLPANFKQQNFLNQLLKWVKEKVIAALSAALGAAIGASGGPVGAIIGAVVGWVVGKVFELFKSIWEDDIFKPATVSVSIPSLNAHWSGGKTDSPQGVITYTGHGGQYQVTYDWRLFA